MFNVFVGRTFKRAFVSASTLGFVFFSMLGSSFAYVKEPSSCETVRFSDVGWTDITSTTAIVSAIIEALGYDPEIKILSIPVTYKSLENKDVDVYLGNWMPAQGSELQPYLDNGSVESLGPNLIGAKYTLAVPQYLYDRGLRDFADIHKFAKELDYKIYGIEPGNEGNGYIREMAEKNEFSLKGFEVVESSEQGMLAQVARAHRKKDPVVFLAWAPHPMNSKYDIEYLSGGDDYFGENYGAAKVYTNVRGGYLEECPNIGKLLKNLVFSVDLENKVMDMIMNDGMEPKDAVMAWITTSEAVTFLKKWTEGVYGYNSKDKAYDLVSKELLNKEKKTKKKRGFFW